MQLNNSQKELIKRELDDGVTVPSIAGKLLNHTPQDTELTEIIAAINKVKQGDVTEESNASSDSIENSDNASEGSTSESVEDDELISERPDNEDVTVSDLDLETLEPDEENTTTIDEEDGESSWSSG